MRRADRALFPCQCFVVPLVFLLSACSPGASPTAPSGATPPPALAGAVLTISGLTLEVVRPTQPGGTFYYNERFQLTETGGKSGATIQNIQSTVENGNSENTGTSCWRQPIRVAPGGTLDTFDTGWDQLGYCAPFAASRAESSRVTVIVLFTDDEGRGGSAIATASVPR